jgi:diguanylate cyclase (GGDEF)-like protein
MFIKKEILLLLTLLIVAAVGTSKFIDFIEEQMMEQRDRVYTQKALAIKDKFLDTLESQHVLTRSVALSLASYPWFELDLTQMLNKLKKIHTHQKIEIGIIDQSGKVVAQSWNLKDTNKRINLSKDIAKMLHKHENIEQIGFYQSSLFFSAMVPIYDTQGSFRGAVVVIKDAKEKLLRELQSMETTLLVLNKKSSKGTTQAIVKHTLSDYNLLSLDNQASARDLIASKGLNYFITNLEYRLYQQHLVVAHKFKDSSIGSGYYLLVTPISWLSYQQMHKLLYILQIIVLTVLLFALLAVFKFYQNKSEIDKQRKHFKEIINSASDIIIVTDSSDAIDVNQAFFRFFGEYEKLEEFEKDYDSIANLFENEEGFIHKQMGPYSWVEYILYHDKNEHEVKIIHKDEEHIFSIKIQELSNQKTKIYTEQLYTVVLTDITKMKRYQAKLESLSKTDMLTKLGNRESFNQHLAMEIARTQRHATELSLIMFDIDNLDGINKLYGHDVGDKVLISIAESIKEFLRTTDVFCRHSSDEFVVLLPKVQHSGALILGERICKHIETLETEPVGGVTISLGLSEFGEGDSAQSFLKRVDRALQKAQESGGNTFRAL